MDRIILFALIIFLAFVIIGHLKNGKVKLRGGDEVNREDDPYMFWVFLSIYMLGAIVFISILIIGPTNIGNYILKLFQ